MLDHIVEYVNNNGFDSTVNYLNKLNISSIQLREMIDNILAPYRNPHWSKYDITNKTHHDILLYLFNRLSDSDDDMEVNANYILWKSFELQQDQHLVSLLYKYIGYQWFDPMNIEGMREFHFRNNKYDDLLLKSFWFRVKNDADPSKVVDTLAKYYQSHFQLSEIRQPYMEWLMALTPADVHQLEFVKLVELAYIYHQAKGTDDRLADHILKLFI